MIRKEILLLLISGVLTVCFGEDSLTGTPETVPDTQMAVADTAIIDEREVTDEKTAAADSIIDTVINTVESNDTLPKASPNSKDTSALSDDDIILADDEETPPGEEIIDSLPPIEKMPELKMFVEAEYPEAIYKKGIEGVVLMELLVNDSGTVDSVTILKSLHPVLDTNALRAASQFVFTPAIAGGEPVAVLIQYEYRYTLKEIVEKVKEYVNFKGTLFERGTKKPIADAMIVLHFLDTLADTTLPVPFSAYLAQLGTFTDQYLEENRLVTITDSMGQFSFYSLPTGPIEITTPLSGYEEFKESEFIHPQEETTVKYYVRRISYSDYEIVVYGKKEEKEVSRRQLTMTEVKKIPGLGGDAVKVIQALPGVARPIFGSGQITVRGAPTWDSQFFLDGVILPRLYHFGGIKSVYNSDALESIDFYPGGFGTRYGNGIAGVIEIKGRPAKTDRWHGILDISTYDGSFLVEGPLANNISILASARRSFIGDILSWYVEHSDQDFPFTITPFYWDYLLRTDYTPAKDNHMSLTLFGGRDSMALIFPQVQGGSQEVSEATDRLGTKQTFHMGLFGWEWKLSDKLANSLRYALTSDRNRTSVFGFFLVEYDALVNDLRNQLTWTLSDKAKYNFGFDMDLYSMDMILVMPGANNALQRDTSENWLIGDVAAYVNFEWKPIEQLLIIPGLRFDYYPELQYDGSLVPEFWNYTGFDNARGISGEPSLRLTARYEFVKNHTAKIAVGNYSQTPQPVGQVIHEDWGEPMLPATKSVHYVLGHEWQISDLIKSDVQLYLNRQWDIPRFARTEDFDINSDDQKLWVGDGRGRMYGLELMLRHDQSERFFGWIAYTLSRTERYNPSTKQYELYDQDETHHLQLVGSWHLRRDWDLGFRMRYVTGKPTTPVIGIIEDEDDNYIEPIYGPKNSERVAPFFQLDLRVDKKWVFKKWMYSIYIDLINTNYFFYKSPELEIYNDFYDDKTTVSNIFTPAIGYRAEF